MKILQMDSRPHGKRLRMADAIEHAIACGMIIKVMTPKGIAAVVPWEEWILANKRRMND